MKGWLHAAVVLCLWQGCMRADVIHLKDGTTLTVDSATESNDVVRYSVGGVQHSLPKSSVGSIERGPAFAIAVGTSSSGWIAAPPHTLRAVPSTGSDARISHGELAAALPAEPSVGTADKAALSRRVINSNGVNERALREVAEEGNAATSAAAYLVAAHYAYDHGDGEAARRYMQNCVALQPQQAGLREWYSILLLDAGQNDEALAQAQRAVKLQPDSADALQVLGMADYDAGRYDEAIDSWKRAQERQPSPLIAKLIEKAQRDAAVEGKFNQREGTHFVLRYEGSQAGFHFASELMYSLEQQYFAIQRELGAPEITITVILYTQQQFFAVTEAPSWSDGLNDGKIRVPVRDLSGVTPQLESVLRHEMVHSFIHAMTRGRCPTWLNEGIAQMEEPRSPAAFAAPLAQMFHQGRAVHLRYLEGSFLRLSPQQAQLAYAESLAAVEYFRSAYGMRGLRRMLESLGEGDPPEAALRYATGASYEDFENGLGGYLASDAH